MKKQKPPISKTKKVKATEKTDTRDYSDTENAFINLAVDLIRGARTGGVYLRAGGEYMKILNAHSRDLGAAAKALNGKDGFLTPYETFIGTILNAYTQNELGLDWIDAALDQLKEDLAGQDADLEKQARLYPEKFRAALAKVEAESKQVGPTKEAA